MLWISIILLPNLEDPTDISSFSSVILISEFTSSSNLWSLAFCFVVRALAPLLTQANSFLSKF